MPDVVTLHINGQEVQATPEQVVLQAASDAGIYIPYLCYHPGMKPYGACRMCVVQVEGTPGTPASCTLPVRDGMKVDTLTDDVVKVRDGILDLLLSEHPHGCLTCHRVDLCGPQDICLRHVSVNDRCVTCPKNERCELKDTTRYHTMGLNSPLTYQYRNLQIETKDPFYDRDYNLCIVCARCVRSCDELRGDVALTVTERAGQVLVGTSLGTSLLESGCEFCGSCIDVCPVGALVERDYKWERPERVERSICSNCPVGCQMNYEVNQRERVIRAIPELNAPANRGQACFKGKFGFDYVNHGQRLNAPLVRRDGALEPASWDEALDLAAEGLGRYQGDQFALVVSPRATNEELYLAQKLARVAMHTNNVDVASNQRRGVLVGLADVLGYYAGTGSIWDLAHAACVLAVSTNVTEEQNVVALPIKQAVRAGTQKLIVIDPREVELTRYAHLWLRPYPGTELALLGGMLRVILDEGLTDDDFLARRCENLRALRESLAPFTLEAVAQESCVPPEQVQEAARIFATSGPASIIYALDSLAGDSRLDSYNQGARRIAVRAMADMALVTGNIGKPGAGLFPLLSGTNEEGAWDVGCIPHLLPGCQPITDTDALERFGHAWGATLPTEPGLGTRTAFDAAREGGVRAMLVVGDHASFNDGTLGDVAGALENLEFLVVQDTFLSPAAQRAHVVLPACTFLEKQGTYTNLERRVQPLKRVFQPKSVDARPDADIICDIAHRLGASGFDYAGPDEVLDEIASLVPYYGGISYARLLKEAVTTPRPSPDNPLPTQVQYSDKVPMGLQWPCPAADHPGTPTLYASAFPSGKARLGVLSWQERPRHQDTRFPLLLAQGRVLAQPDRSMEIVRTDGLNRIERLEFLVMTQEDAERSGVREGQTVRAVTPSGPRVQGMVRLSSSALPGVVSLTTLFGDLALALDASEHPDPMNHVPRLEVAPVRLEPIS